MLLDSIQEVASQFKSLKIPSVRDPELVQVFLSATR